MGWMKVATGGATEVVVNLPNALTMEPKGLV